MNNTKHTPGPWTIAGHDDADTMEIWDKHGAFASCETRNARLIAAAPDLLAACQLALACADPDYDRDMDPEGVITTLEKAIGKATGIYGTTCPSCGRDNSEYGNVCTSDDCPANTNSPMGRRCTVRQVNRDTNKEERL